MLHIDRLGEGPDLVMVHGWGMHSGIWSDWTQILAQRFRVHRVDLPGHGLSRTTQATSLDDWSGEVMRVAPRNAYWLGWSLGGLVALNAARLFADRVRGLVLVAGTPKFVRADDWPHAVDGAVFEQFAAQLDEDIERTLTRFLALQVRGADNSGAALKILRSQLASRPRAQAHALAAGLALLQASDLRAVPGATRVPLYWLFGERDTLVPAALAEQLAGSRATIQGGGHAPFLSHPRQAADQVCDWLLADKRGSGCANY